MNRPLTLEHRRILDFVEGRGLTPDGARAVAVDYLVTARLIVASKGSQRAVLTGKGAEALKYHRVYGWGGPGTQT
ncbi:MAG TPA: hypothetical protein VM492_13535 [Sumerlaeia bacterium]|nr:hypothetical protein [Sumerlaeia bacterium]